MFLHVQGVGWLMENKGSCCIHCLMKMNPITIHYRYHYHSHPCAYSRSMIYVSYILTLLTLSLSFTIPLIHAFFSGPMICMELCGPPEKTLDSHPHPRHHPHKGSPTDADDGLPPFPVKDKKHMMPVKVIDFLHYHLLIP